MPDATALVHTVSVTLDLAFSGLHVFNRCSFELHFYPPIFFPPLTFLGLPFGPPPKTFLALLAFEKCSGPCKASVLALPFLPMALAAAERGEGFLGFIGVAVWIRQHDIAV